MPPSQSRSTGPSETGSILWILMPTEEQAAAYGAYAPPEGPAVPPTTA